MRCIDCGRFPDPEIGGRGWYAATLDINYCPVCATFRRTLGKWRPDSSIDVGADTAPTSGDESEAQTQKRRRPE